MSEEKAKTLHKDQNSPYAIAPRRVSSDRERTPQHVVGRRTAL